MLPNSAMAVPMSENAHPPKTWTSLTLSLSASPKWISNPPLEDILNALLRDPARLADSCGSILSRMRGGTRLSFLRGSGLVHLESEPDPPAEAPHLAL